MIVCVRVYVRVCMCACVCVHARVAVRVCACMKLYKEQCTEKSKSRNEDILKSVNYESLE